MIMIGNKPTITCYINVFCIIQIYSGITSGRVLDGELLFTVILEVNLFAFAYTLFYFMKISLQLMRPRIHKDYRSYYTIYEVS